MRYFKVNITLVLLLTLSVLYSCSTVKNTEVQKPSKLHLAVGKEVQTQVLEKLAQDKAAYAKDIRLGIVSEQAVKNLEILRYVFLPSLKFDDKRLRISSKIDSVENFMLPDCAYQLFYGEQEGDIKMVFHARKSGTQKLSDEGLEVIRQLKGEEGVKSYLEQEKSKLPFQHWSLNLPVEIDAAYKSLLTAALKEADDNVIFTVTLRGYPYIGYYEKGALTLRERYRKLDTDAIRAMLKSENEILKTNIRLSN